MGYRETVRPSDLVAGKLGRTKLFVVVAMGDLLYGVPDPVSLGLPPISDEGVPKCDPPCVGDGRLSSLLHLPTTPANPHC